MSKCTHPHGDYIRQMSFWLCGKCYEKLEVRPTRYGPSFGPNLSETRAPQQIRWQAEIRKSDAGLTLNDFVRGIAKRFQTKAKMDAHEAINLAIECLRNYDEEFGDPAFIWDATAAQDFADEELSYWGEDDASDGGANR